MSHHIATPTKPMQWLKAMVLLVMLVLAQANAFAQATVTFFHNDIAGTPLAATDSAGNLVWKETYRPYGDRLTQSPASSTNSVWFTSKPQDPHTGLVYMGARYYDPVIGRFMGVDPVGFQEDNLHSFNRYAYGNNNPVKYLDPDGRQVRKILDHRPLMLLDGGGGGGGGGTSLNDTLEASGMAPLSDAALAAGIASGSGARSLIPTFGRGAAKGLVDLTEHRAAHILNRHRAGTGISGKTEFPARWSDKDILHHVSDIATDPRSTMGVGKWNSPYAVGTRDGVTIRVDFYPPNHPTHAGKISTAYPTNVAPNP